MKLKSIALLLIIVLVSGTGIMATSKKDNPIKGTVKGQTIDGNWWWTVVTDDGSILKLDWWSLGKSGNKERVKSLKNKVVLVDGDIEGDQIKNIQSIEEFENNKVNITETKGKKKQAKLGDLSGKINGRQINGKFWWTLEGDNGKLYKFNWYALDQAGYKEKIKELNGKSVSVVSFMAEEQDGVITIKRFQSIEIL